MDQAQKRVRCRGRVSKVEAKFAYVFEENLGSIFVPLSVAVSKDVYVSHLSDVYQVGDEVYIVAEPQQRAKNACNWIATSMRHFRKNPELETEQSIPQQHVSFPQPNDVDLSEFQQCTVTFVTETFAYANHLKLGSIFVPGVAFSNTDISRLNAVLDINSQVLLKIERQPVLNGCSWKAVQATKWIASSATEIAGHGIISVMSDYSCRVYSKDLDMDVYCNLLTYVGGDKEKNSEKLPDVVKIGEAVMFSAVYREPDLCATCWYPVDAKATAVSYRERRDMCVQTDQMIETLALRSLQPELGAYMSDKPVINKHLNEVCRFGNCDISLQMSYQNFPNNN